MNDNFLEIRYNNISVFHTDELNGGGTTHGQQFIPVIRALFGKVSRVFEFCAGPGYIGFSVLSEKLCDRLYLSDIDPLAIEAIERTVVTNSLEDRVSYFLSDGLKDIPRCERFDLVVANPPHYSGGVSRGIIANDVDWKIHEALYSSITNYLAPHGSILILENYHGSAEADFVEMIERAGLTIFQSFMYKLTIGSIANPYYFLWIRRKDHLLISTSFPAGENISCELGSLTSIHLEENTKYFFELFDKHDRDVGLKDNNDVKFFRLKPFVSIRHQHGVSCSLLLTSGIFFLYDLKTSEVLLKVTVGAETVPLQ